MSLDRPGLPEAIDRDHLARQTFGDAALAREVLALFAAQCDRLATVIAGSGAAESRLEAAHTLKGAARAVGAWRIAALAERLEAGLGARDEGPLAAELVAACRAAADAVLADRERDESAGLRLSPTG